MILGIDVSTLFDEYDNGAKYFSDGKLLNKYEPLDMFRNNGVSFMRIRLWNDPYDDKGNKYLGGTCDFDNFVRLSKLSMEKGYKILLDFHYSDFWADPGKQMIPKAWRGLSLEQLEKEIYNYTLNTLEKAKNEGIKIEAVQIGNEITNGILWPIGRLIEEEGKERSNYDALIKLLKSASLAVRKFDPSIMIILHLERSYDQVIYNEFFTKMIVNNVDFDCIGASYYPYWHGTMEEFFANMKMCRKFNKKIMVMELGYAFTLEDYIKTNNGNIDLVVNKDNLNSFNFTKKYPFNPEGQRRFIKDFLELAKLNKLDGVFYWEPLWIPGKEICWASVEGEEYINETNKPTRNEWANQCLFDYDGNKLPSFDEFKL